MILFENFSVRIKQKKSAKQNILANGWTRSLQIRQIWGSSMRLDYGWIVVVLVFLLFYVNFSFFYF